MFSFNYYYYQFSQLITIRVYTSINLFKNMFLSLKKKKKYEESWGWYISFDDPTTDSI